METELKLGEMIVRQKYYVTIKKGYAVCFVTAFSTDEEQESLHKILETVKFE